jgi:predicted MFS family arabinose efflux permease
MHPAPASPYRYALGGMIGMAAAMGIGRFVFTPILPGMMHELGLSPAQAGFIASANYLGYLVGAVLGAGGWAHGRERPIMLAAIATSALLCASMGLTQNLYAFLAIRFAAGSASAFMLVFLATIVFSHLAAAGRSDLQALHFSGVGLGISISAVMTGALVVAYQPWQAGWLWAGAISAIAFPLVLWLVREGPVAGEGQGREPPLPNSPALRRIVWSYGLFGFGYIVTATFLVAIVRSGDGGRLFEAGVWLVTGLTIAPSNFLWARLARRFGLSPVVAAGCVVEALGVMASVSIGGYAGPIIAAVLLGGTFVAITSLGLQMGRSLAGASPRRALALMTAAFGTGQIIGPLVAGWLASASGSYFTASAMAAACLVASAWLAWQSGRFSVLR